MKALTEKEFFRRLDSMIAENVAPKEHPYPQYHITFHVPYGSRPRTFRELIRLCLDMPFPPSVEGVRQRSVRLIDGAWPASKPNPKCIGCIRAGPCGVRPDDGCSFQNPEVWACRVLIPLRLCRECGAELGFRGQCVSALCPRYLEEEL